MIGNPAAGLHLVENAGQNEATTVRKEKCQRIPLATAEFAPAYPANRRLSFPTNSSENSSILLRESRI